MRLGYQVWLSFLDEMTKLSSKPRQTIKLPSPNGGGGQNFGRFTDSPAPTKVTGETRKVSKSDSLLQIGRTGSVTDTPPPPPVI